MLDMIAQFDALGLGTLAGSLLFLAGLIWVLVDNRSFEDVSRRHQDAVAPKARPVTATIVTWPADAVTVEESVARSVARSVEGSVARPAGEPVGPLKGPQRDDPAGPGRGAPTRPNRGPGRPVRTRRVA